MMQGNNQVATVAANVAVHDGDSDEESEDERTFVQKYGCGLIMLLLAAIGGAVAGSLLSQGSDSGTPAEAVTNFPSPPTNAPTTSLKYDPPSEATCARLSDGNSTVVQTEFEQYVDLFF